MRLILSGGALFMLACLDPALAQDRSPAAGAPVAFAPVTGLPTPLQSTSGRFSSLNPTKRSSCSISKVTGRVVSPHLIMVNENFCGKGQSGNVLVNVEFANAGDAAQMVVGKQVTLAANFKDAEESRTSQFYANYLIAEKARLVDAGTNTPPTSAFTSYMICQPPELDALAGKLGSELCVQSTLVQNLAATAPALQAAARAPVKVAAEDDVPGDPNAIVCRQDLERSDVHLSSIACARGSYWDWYRSKWRDHLYFAAAPP